MYDSVQYIVYINIIYKVLRNYCLMLESLTSFWALISKHPVCVCVWVDICTHNSGGGGGGATTSLLCTKS